MRARCPQVGNRLHGRGGGRGIRFRTDQRQERERTAKTCGGNQKIKLVRKIPGGTVRITTDAKQTKPGIFGKGASQHLTGSAGKTEASVQSGKGVICMTGPWGEKGPSLLGSGMCRSKYFTLECAGKTEKTKSMKKV